VRRAVRTSGQCHIDTREEIDLPSPMDGVSYEEGGGKQPRIEFNAAATRLKDRRTPPECR